MTDTRCPRLFEVEAARDGRLAGAQLASFTRHVALCAACAREVKALDQLADGLRASPSGDERQGDELHAARERVRLLGAFDRALLASGAPRGAWLRRFRPVAVGAIAAVCVLAVWRVRGTVAPVRAASAVVRADSAAVWSRRADGDREEIVIVEGALSIHVEHAAAGTRQLVVRLPDGELEDTGTTFTVIAAGGQTRRVAVQEGSVVLRIRGRPAIAIRAGDAWMPDAPAAAPADSGAAAPPAPSAGRATPPAPAPRHSTAGRALAVPDPSVDFRAAMAVLDVGANREAAAAFASFLVRHPRDPRAEDAAYLRVIALQRCGADNDMRRAAAEYLRLYPAGFRRAEVEKLSQ